MTDHVGQQRATRQEGANNSRVHEFLSMNPPSFTRSSPTEDPNTFVDELKKVIEVMHVVDIKRVEWAPYQLKGVVEFCLINGRMVELRIHHVEVGLVSKKHYWGRSFVEN